MPSPITAECLSEVAGVAHGFFTREGGVSTGIYAALNCGLGSNDDAGSVSENRDRVAKHLHANARAVVTLYQIHSPTAVIVDDVLARDNLPRADALVTRTPGLVIGALAADCTPVLFADPVAKVVAAAHAGWRGAVGGVLGAAVEAMESLGASRSRIRAAVGPCIGQEDYEVGPEFEAQFLEESGANSRFFAHPPGAPRPRFALASYVEDRLKRLGLGEVEMRTQCTYANESLYFSYRRSQARKEPDYGRQISAIVVA